LAVPASGSGDSRQGDSQGHELTERQDNVLFPISEKQHQQCAACQEGSGERSGQAEQAGGLKQTSQTEENDAHQQSLRSLTA
jgi:hypothetical protein